MSLWLEFGAHMVSEDSVESCDLRLLPVREHREETSIVDIEVLSSMQ